MITDRDDEFRGTITFFFNQEVGHDPDADQMHAYLVWCRAGATGEQIQQRLHDEPEAVAFRSRPKPPPASSVPALGVNGVDFTVDGERVVLRGTDQFMALRMVLDGTDLRPLIGESRELDFNLWRVFGTGSRRQNGILELRPTELGYYDALQALAAQLHDAGIRLLFTAHVDNQDVRAPADHWLRCADVLRPYQALLSGGNEWSKNGFDPGSLTDPGMLWSRGSDVGDVAPFRPYGSFGEFHPRRDLPASLMDTIASPVFIYGHGLHAPLIIDEPPRMGANGSGAEYADPRVCWEFGRNYATMCAGAVFHSRPGQSGQVMDPLTRACAEAWQRGMTA